MEVTQFLFVCGIFVVIGSPIYATCPKDPTTAIQLCSNDLGIDPSKGGGHNLVGDTTMAKQMCKSNKMTQAIDCMQAIMNDCSESPQNELLHNMINVQGWKDAMKALCDNIDYLKENQDCMAKGRASMEICIEKESKLFQTEMRVKMEKIMAEGQSSKAKLMKMTCGLIGKMLSCITDSPMKLCPEKMMNIIKKVFYGFVPPMCIDEIPKLQQGKYAVDANDGKGSGSTVIGSAVVVFLAALSSGYVTM